MKNNGNIKNILKKTFPFLRYFKYAFIGRRIFTSIYDLKNFYNLINHNFPGEKRLLELHAKGAGKDNLYCRTDSTDIGVFWNCFYYKLHLPTSALKNPKVIIDLGANVGFTTRSFRYIYPNARIFAIEMDIENYELAKKNLVNQLDNNCHLLNAAIWTSDGIITYRGGEDFASINTNISDEMKTANSITMNTLLSKFDISYVDYIKIDIEGAEKELFSNNLDWLDKVKTISLEYHDSNEIFYISKLKQYGFTTEKNKSRLPTIIATKSP